MQDEYSYLPGILHEIAEVAGRPAALAIAEKRGGSRVYFPVAAPVGHWLRDLVGDEAVEKLCVHFRSTNRGGICVDIPLGQKGFYVNARKTALKLLEGGLSQYEVARRVGVDRGTVKRWKAQERAAEESRNKSGS